MAGGDQLVTKDVGDVAVTTSSCTGPDPVANHMIEQITNSQTTKIETGFIHLKKYVSHY
jgi:hypothetical protein